MSLCQCVHWVFGEALRDHSPLKERAPGAKALRLDHVIWWPRRQSEIRHTHTRMHTRTNTRTYAGTHPLTTTQAHTHTHTRTRMHTHTHKHTHTHTHTCIHTHAHIQTHTCTHKIFILAFYKYNLNNGIIYVQYNMNDNINLYQDGIPCIWLNIVKIRWKNMK